MNTNNITSHIARPAGYRDLAPAATSEPDVLLDLAPPRRGHRFSESLALGIARVFGLEPFFMDGPPQTAGVRAGAIDPVRSQH
jgi:hypothetical protein